MDIPGSSRNAEISILGVSAVLFHPSDSSCLISNRDSLKHVAEHYDVPFHCLPIEKGEKRDQELQIEALLTEHKIDLVVLARYMQILSPEFCDPRLGSVIPFEYCLSEGGKERPCWKAIDCWWEYFDVVSFLREHLEAEEFCRLENARPKPKVSSLLEQIAQAKARLES